MIDLASQLFFTEEKNAIYEFIEAILKEMNYSKKGIERHKSLVMSAENEIRFQSSSKC